MKPDDETNPAADEQAVDCNQATQHHPTGPPPGDKVGGTAPNEWLGVAVAMAGAAARSGERRGIFKAPEEPDYPVVFGPESDRERVLAAARAAGIEVLAVGQASAGPEYLFTAVVHTTDPRTLRRIIGVD